MTPPLSGRAMLAGVIGWPVAHSLSPRLHGHWLAEHGIDGAYVPLPVPPERLAAALQGLVALGFRGSNVTVPHKEAVLGRMTTLTERARRIGAVNTIVVGSDGSLHGDSTDGAGFLANLRDHVPTWLPAAGPAVVLGAGGAARAVVDALLEAGVPAVTVANRTVARAEALARDLEPARITPCPLDDVAVRFADTAVLVNTTTVGMTQDAGDVPDLSRLPHRAIVTDIVYTPLHTPLLRAAAARGLAVVDGIGMLLHQAVPGFAAWFGTSPAVTPALRQHVLAGLGAG